MFAVCKEGYAGVDSTHGTLGYSLLFPVVDCNALSVSCNKDGTLDLFYGGASFLGVTSVVLTCGVQI